MEHPFFPTTTTRAEALRWLTIAEKLLSGRDLMGSKSFATRARDADPTLSPADQILAVVDTLIAGERRIGDDQQDLYAILRLTPQRGRDVELIAGQYRSLALLLNPQNNKFPFAEEAFGLVLSAWSILSNPSKKFLYDRGLAFCLHPQQQQQQQPQPDPFGNPAPAFNQNFIFFGGSSSSGVTHPPQPQTAVHFSQVHANSQVDPLAGGSAREEQNFMNFTLGSNLVFGSESGSVAGHETVNKLQAQESYSTVAGNAASAPGANQGQVNNKNEHPQQNYSNVGYRPSDDVKVGENVGERIDGEEDMERMESQEKMDAPVSDDGSTFWTACPYCYHMYEYPGVYEDCTLRCQNCKRAFQAVVIPSPPPTADGQEGYLCCWGFLPMGFSMENWERNKGSASSWTPFSPMFTCPQVWNASNTTKKAGRKSSAPRIYVDDDDDDEVFVEVSDSSGSDDDWNNDEEKRRKKAKKVRRKGAGVAPNRSAKKAQVDKGKNVNVQDGFVSPNGVETPNRPAGELSKKGPVAVARKQPDRVAKNFGKLDLNVECSNEVEEPAPMVNQGSGPSHGEDDNIEGIGFFEGLDEFLSTLPILNAVGDDKVVKAA